MLQFVKVIGYIVEDLNSIQKVEQYINMNDVFRFIIKTVEGETNCVLYCKNSTDVYIVHPDSYLIIDRLMDNAIQNDEMVSPL